MKVIFLDIDGVLNSQPDCKATKYKMCVGGCGCIGIYKPRVRNLAAIVKATDAKIVLVSSWKDSYRYYENNWFKDPLDYDYDVFKYGKYLRDKLREFNLEIYDTTYDYEPNMWLRGEGIKNWIAKHEVESFVILDDEKFDYERQNLLDKLVKTSFYQGALDEHHVAMAIDILNKKGDYHGSRL